MSNVSKFKAGTVKKSSSAKRPLTGIEPALL